MENDNDPAPLNIPDGTTTKSSTPNGKWVCNGQCCRKLMGAHNIKPNLNKVSGINLDVFGYVAMFLMFLPTFFVETVIVKLTSDALVQPLSMGEFLRFIGIWLLITHASPGNIN